VFFQLGIGKHNRTTWNRTSHRFESTDDFVLHEFQSLEDLFTLVFARDGIKRTLLVVLAQFFCDEFVPAKNARNDSL